MGQIVTHTTHKRGEGIEIVVCSIVKSTKQIRSFVGDEVTTSSGEATDRDSIIYVCSFTVLRLKIQEV